MSDGVSHQCHTARAKTGAPGRARTCDPRLRRPMLYPTELRARGSSVAWVEVCP
jgi:hypothetical protein